MSFALAEEAVSEVAEQVAEAAENAGGRLTLDIGGNLLYAILGYLVVFIGLSLLMFVIIIVGKIMVAKMKKPAAETAIPAVAAAPAVKSLPAAPGTAGEADKSAGNRSGQTRQERPGSVGCPGGAL